MKKIKHIISMALALILGMSLCAPAYATEAQEENDSECAILITVNSPEEYDNVVAELEAHNIRANQLWQQALSESRLPENQASLLGLNNLDTAVTLSSYVVNSKTYNDWIDFFTVAYLTFSATYTTTSNVYGATVLGEIRDIDVYGRANGTTVTVRDYDTTRIDSGRTLAVHYSCRVGVLNSNDNTYTYYSRQYYVEFYASGGALVYD